MNLYIMTDVEGVAGVFSFQQQAYPDGKYFENAKRLLTGEVNAAVDGAISAGARDILVEDGHGAGGLCYELLHERARLLQGGPRLPVKQRKPLYSKYDATCIVGQHAMEGTPDGNLNHTQSSQVVLEYRLNDEPIGEAAQWALCMGAYGVPMIFLSGDEAACREAEKLIPGITTAAVKQGISRGCAINLSQPRAHELIREKMAEAVEKQKADPIAPLVWPGPYRLVIEYKHTDNADHREQGGWQRIDSRSVAIESDDVLDIIYA